MTFREHALDGAMLYFDRSTGTSVRVENERTTSFRRKAPRVVMFGITNACNLRCEFCSRDVQRRSAWTVDSAAEMLEGLAAAGTLEVAFGGGEPYAFRGLGELVARLRRTTDLALHVTTNGTLIDPAIDFDMVRLSIYGADWRAHAQKLFRRRWGANVIVEDRNLELLPGLLLDLARAGAHDVSLLSYVGPDDARHLSSANEPVLAAIVDASPIPCRVSVCWGDRVSGRLFGGDCGAGLDFITLTSDRRLQSCSFQDASVPVESAAEVLAHWRKRAMTEASSRRGCSRASKPTATAGIRIYQGFSGNNSGECVLVARFDEVADAEKLLAELSGDSEPGEEYPPSWKELFRREDVVSSGMAHSLSPDEMIAVGATFLARTDMAAADDFPELRALAWKRGAHVVPGGIHVHGATQALFVVRVPRSAESVEDVLGRARAETAIAVRHGDRVVGVVDRPKLVDMKDALLRITGKSALAMELFSQPGDNAKPLTEQDLVHALPHTSHLPEPTPRLAVWFWNEGADAFAQFADAKNHGGLVLIENLTRYKRLALQGIRRGAQVSLLTGEELLVGGNFWPPERERTKGVKTPPPPPIDLDRLRGEFELRGLRGAKLERLTWGGRVHIEVTTDRPAFVLATLEAVARAEKLDYWFGVDDIERLGKAMIRLFRATSSA